MTPDSTTPSARTEQGVDLDAIERIKALAARLADPDCKWGTDDAPLRRAGHREHDRRHPVRPRRIAKGR